MKDLSYWDRLKRLGLYSQQRRRDRYCVEDPGEAGSRSNRQRTPGETKWSDWKAPERVRSLPASNLGHNGPKIFNSLPKEVRDIEGCPVDIFEGVLDKSLKTLRDEPPVSGYTGNCRAASNSIPDQTGPSKGRTGRKHWWWTTTVRMEPLDAFNKNKKKINEKMSICCGLPFEFIGDIVFYHIISTDFSTDQYNIHASIQL
ncbi:hypothetical protein Pcinc_026878 [Petrolisthes cinctipes]|uniref:Uncharacterized protein n=1 Tax=Petrolisthes cinctipes TaxID=88211 RepID=A0AAE1F534_PETCI|nr:hypothetical protein Pcinc_026878 [Petrolisthes cinctipes]